VEDFLVQRASLPLGKAGDYPVAIVSVSLERTREGLTQDARIAASPCVFRSAVTRNGEIAAREAVVLMDCSAYGGAQIFLTTMTAQTLFGNTRLGAASPDPQRGGDGGLQRRRRHRPEEIPLTPPRVLATMLGGAPKVELPHIAKAFADNVIGRLA
jgi:hypothetical protein